MGPELGIGLEEKRTGMMWSFARGEVSWVHWQGWMVPKSKKTGVKEPVSLLRVPFFGLVQSEPGNNNPSSSLFRGGGGRIRNCSISEVARKTMLTSVVDMALWEAFGLRTIARFGTCHEMIDTPTAGKGGSGSELSA